MTVDLVPVYTLIYSILDASNTDLGSGRLQASGYVLSSHLTSNVHSTRARASAAHTILPPAINSGVSDVANGWQCDLWFK